MLELTCGTLVGDFLECLDNIGHRNIDMYRIFISSLVMVSKPPNNSSLRMFYNFILFFKHIEKTIQFLSVKATTTKGDDPQKLEPPKGTSRYTNILYKLSYGTSCHCNKNFL
jgi:hypothetical protein